MSSANWTELETALTDAVHKAIKQVGFSTFLATSLFASNEKKTSLKGDNVKVSPPSAAAFSSESVTLAPKV